MKLECLLSDNGNTTHHILQYFLCLVLPVFRTHITCLNLLCLLFYTTLCHFDVFKFVVRIKHCKI